MKLFKISCLLFNKALKNKCSIIVYLILPTIIISLIALVCSNNIMSGNQKVRVVDNDNSRLSKYFISNLYDGYGFYVDVIKDDLIEKPIVEDDTVAVIKIPDNFQNDIISSKDTTIKIIYPSGAESDELISKIVKTNIVNLKELIYMYNKDIDKFNDLLKSFHEGNVDLDRINSNKDIKIGYITIVVMMIFMTIMVTSALSVIIDDINKGMLHRVLPKDTSYAEYISGHIIWVVFLNIIQIFLLVNTISIFDIDTGVSLKTYIFILGLISVLSVSLGIFCVSFCEKKAYVSIINILIIIPSCIFSGCTMPIELMNNSFRKFSFVLPQRYILLIAEYVIEKKSSLMLFIYIISLVLISLVLTVTGIRNIENRMLNAK